MYTRKSLEKYFNYCSYSLEIISLVLNTSYCQIARLLRPFNTTSKTAVHKPNTCQKVGHQLVWNQRSVSYFLIPFHRRKELSRRLLNTLAFLQNTWWSRWPNVPPPYGTSSSPAFKGPIVSLHHSVLFHHLVSIAWLAAGLYTQTFIDRKATLTWITFKFASVWRGSLSIHKCRLPWL